jgi:hypothetical protein
LSATFARVAEELHHQYAGFASHSTAKFTRQVKVGRAASPHAQETYVAK